MEITPWPKIHPATEKDVKEEVRASGLPTVRWQAKPHKKYPKHHHLLAKTLWCVEGSISFHVDGRDVNLRPGDKIVIPAGLVHSVEAGPEGAVCYESPPVRKTMTVQDE